jgi:hypothetical protein
MRGEKRSAFPPASSESLAQPVDVQGFGFFELWKMGSTNPAVGL